MDISIIIVTYNAKDVTVKMLDSLRKSLDYIDLKSDKKIKYEVIVVENGSTDGIREELQDKNYSWFKLILNDNVGFAKGNNLAIRNTDKDTKYVLLLNPDIIVEQKCIYDMYMYIKEHEEVGILTCEIKLWSGGLDIDAHRGFPTPWRAFCYFTKLEKLLGRKLPRLFGGYHLMKEDLTRIHEIDVCLGAFMFIPKKVGDKINWLPEDYFLNGEDVDFCYQIKEILGYKIIYNPDNFVTHFKGASKGTKKQSENITKATESVKTKTVKSGVESMKIFYNKYYKEKYPFWVDWIVRFGIWVLSIKRMILKKE